MFAAIDIGTNSVRLLIAKVEGKKIIPIKRALRSTRLGQNINTTKLLKKEAIERTAHAVHDFVLIAKEQEVEGIKIVATSAARDATNSRELIEAIENTSQEVFNIISGEEEAFLSFRGATNSLGKAIDLKKGIVIDIGGGSTELIFTNKAGEISSTSTNVGAVRCTEGKCTYEQIKEALTPVLQEIQPEKEYELLGVGGTITSLASIDQQLVPYDPEKVQGYVLSLAKIKEISSSLEKLSIEERKKVAGLKPDRADIILAGITIAIVIMEELQQEAITVSESDLLDALILEMHEGGQK